MKPELKTIFCISERELHNKPLPQKAETIEEIGITASKNFIKYGGEDLQLVPSLNNHPEWVETLSKIIRKHLIP